MNIMFSRHECDYIDGGWTYSDGGRAMNIMLNILPHVPLLTPSWGMGTWRADRNMIIQIGDGYIQMVIEVSILEH